jgi:septal ring factor EnvC (AmiA/AmiB activator)
MRIFYLLLVIAFFSPSPLWSKDVKDLEKTIEEKKGNLTEIQEQLQEKKSMARKKWWQEKKITDGMDEIELRLNRKERELRTLHAEMKKLEKKVAKHEEEITKLEIQLTALDERFKSRVRAMYKLHRVGMVRVLFSAENYSDALRRYKASRLAVESDLQLLQTYLGAIEEKERTKRELLDEKKNLLIKKREIEVKKLDIKKEKRKKASLLAAVKTERVAYQKAIDELKEREKAMVSLIETLRIKVVSLKGGNFKALQGNLPSPVRGTIFAPEGRKRGIGIKAPEGAEIKAVFDGTVAYASWFKGYGNLMIIDHGDGYHTILAHASRLLKEVGEDVKMGEVVALVGSTGSIEGPMLYFEIRHHGISESPLKWLAGHPQ